MGVNVTIDGALLDKAVEAAGLGSNEATIEQALKLLIDDGDQRRHAIERSAGIGWEGNLDAIREGRADHGDR